ncbi:hypothetical protein [Microbacterium sp. Bi128]|uniref:hypothetical protein n=1 Tax=Microbacterium sp. Bi128 TaxID=2821115 RepID=UPI001D9418F7|nr:hypothetical protein [Microbacterium sp. Bi128]CAH0253855.1 hypothetical protein SRABI128_02977 [Microbacterium sp. Bi128]
MNTDDARAAVQASGLLEALDGPHFHVGVPPTHPLGSASSWTPAFLPTAEQPHPDFARVIIKRTGQSAREVVIAWAEYEAREEVTPNWNATRTASPMTVFGGECERHAYLVVFADVLAPLLDAERAAAVLDGIRVAGTPARDWASEIAAASDAAALVTLWEEAKGQRTPELERAMVDRRQQLTAPRPTAAAVTPAPQAAESATPRPSTPARPAATPRPPRREVPQLAEPVKPGAPRKASSRAERDSGRRGGGRR